MKRGIFHRKVEEDGEWMTRSISRETLEKCVKAPEVFRVFRELANDQTSREDILRSLE